jgi:hypothetical protein
MKEHEITNWLIFGVAVAWFCKIGFHFLYLKAVDASIKELNFISFHLKIENLFTSVLLVSPFFFSRTGTEEQKTKRTKWKARISTCLLWAMFGVTAFYLYHHPPKKETETVKYDMTNGGVR